MAPRAVPFALAGALSLGAIAAAVMDTPIVADQALLAARWTARAAIPVFLVVYLAGPMHRLRPSAITRMLMQYRRQWGLAFAFSMTIHLAALLVNILVFRPREIGEIAAGMAAYAMIYVMAATSNRWSVKRLGRWWQRIHRVGIHYIWLIFFGGRVLRSIGEEAEYHRDARIMAAILLVAALIRLAAWLKVRERRTRVQPPLAAD